MWQKIKCWLGWHKWIFVCLECKKAKCKGCIFSKKEKSRLYCKHCGEVKK